MTLAIHANYICILVLIALLCSFYNINCFEQRVYKTKYITVPVDHFSFARNKTFKLKYLINDTFWKSGGPIFFYTGNEDCIELFAENVGFMWEIAPKFGAMVVFAEHRYYGESLPFGKKSFSSRYHFGYLTSTQALRDYVYLINFLQENLRNTKGCNATGKVIAFGGSYGGMLAAWLRLKYPAFVDGVVAASAPIYQFFGLTKCNRFNDVLVEAYKTLVSESCIRNIKKSWATLRYIAASPNGKKNLAPMLNLCKSIRTERDMNELSYWLSEMYANLAMMNYPYPCYDLPANPVQVFCSYFSAQNLQREKLLITLGNALTVYYNYTGKSKCIDVYESWINPNEKAWYYQSCTELVMPMCVKDNEMFEPSVWNFTSFSGTCYKQLGIRVDSQRLAYMEYGGKKVNYSNVIFTNGKLDPWHAGGFLTSQASARAILMPDTAHHLDLRASHPNDPTSVVQARLQIERDIHYWLND